MRPNTMNKFGAVLDDFGLETMLDKLMEDFIRPISEVFFSDVGGSTLDSHHGFVVEYGIDRDVELGFHVDDSEVTLNVCLGKQFSGGDLFFRGIRCDKHVNTETQSDEILDYSHVPGRAVLHLGHHRHGARATTSGHRVNLLLWCRSSIFRELRKYQKDLSSWCGECQREKKERQRVSIAATKQGFPDFISSVVSQLTVNLKRIHNLGMRKIAVSALQPLGCLPQSTAQFSFQQCNETENTLVDLHNQLLVQAVNNLNKQTNSTSFFILDLYNAFWTVFNQKEAHQVSPKFENPFQPCCVGVSPGFSCGSVDEHEVKKYTLCSNPKSKFFWDTVHPTQEGWQAVYSTPAFQNSLKQFW